MLSGCSAAGTSPNVGGDLDGGSAAPSPGAVVTQEESATPTPSAPAADLIRALNPEDLSWTWFDDHSSTRPVSVPGPDEYGRLYSVGEPLYSDADGDGLEDMAVPISELDGNGFREHWHVWVAQADGTATQVLIPIAATARCGDNTRSVSAVEGGFEVEERLREPIIDDPLPCSDEGTFESVRRVAVAHVGEAAYPVNLDDPRGYGGVCPTQPRTETEVTKVWGSAYPALGAPLTFDGEDMYLIQPYTHTLTQGADPMRLAAVWPPDGHSDNRLCVWIDPVRFEGSGE